MSTYAFNPECKTCDLCVQSEQPPNWEHSTVDGVFIKQMFLKLKGTVVPQHSHRYDHTSMLATGAVRVWAEGEYLGIFKAPSPIFIKALIKHTFKTLEDNTLIYCIHRGTPETTARNSLKESAKCLGI